MKLRPYQEDAVKAGLDALTAGRNPVLSLPTGSGKSLMLAALCQDALARGRRVLVATHRRELLTQDAAALHDLAPEIESGIYSAGLERRDSRQPVILGGVQSIHGRMAELQQAGKFGLVMVDECHLVPRSADTMYGSVFRALPNVPRLGLSATPYRLDSGMLHEGPGALFDTLAIHIEPRSLVPEYLAPLIGVGTNEVISTEGVHTSRGDYVASELAEGAMDPELIQDTVSEILRLAVDRDHILIFCITVVHAEMVADEIDRREEDVQMMTGDTPPELRNDILAQFKAGTLRFLVNVEVLTTGFDAPCTDCIVMLRPTQSRGLYIQICGRGMRKADGKEDCAVLDFAGNIQRHGSINDLMEKYIPSAREEQEKEREQAARARAIDHSRRALGGNPMGEDDSPLAVELPVRRMQYSLFPSKKYAGKTNLMVTYVCTGRSVRHFICCEYPGGAAYHASRWFLKRGVLMPNTAEEAMAVAKKLPIPTSITTRKEGEYDRIITEHFVEHQEPELFA